MLNRRFDDDGVVPCATVRIVRTTSENDRIVTIPADQRAET